MSNEKQQPTLCTDKDHPECYCQECGGVNSHWSAHSELWNKLTKDSPGILCPNCFDKKAEDAGISLWFAAVPLEYLNEALNVATLLAENERLRKEVAKLWNDDNEEINDLRNENRKAFEKIGKLASMVGVSAASSQEIADLKYYIKELRLLIDDDAVRKLSDVAFLKTVDSLLK